MIDVDTQEWPDLNTGTIVRLIAISRAVPPFLISNPPTSHGHSHAIVSPRETAREHLFLPGRVINIHTSLSVLYTVPYSPSDTLSRENALGGGAGGGSIRAKFDGRVVTLNAFNIFELRRLPGGPPELIYVICRSGVER